MHRSVVAAALSFAQLDEVPVVIPRLAVWILAHPDGAGSGVEMPLRLRLRLVRLLGFPEDVAEKGLQDGHAAAYEARVDFDDAVVES